MSAPSTANTDQLENPVWPKPNQQAGTEPGAWGGNKPCEAPVKEYISHNASEGVEPRNNSLLHEVKGFISWKPETGRARKGECVTGMPGSESVAGERTACIGTWENRSVPTSPQEAEEAGRGYVAAVVGPDHSRGVNRVMSVESGSSLKGSGALTQREEG